MFKRIAKYLAFIVVFVLVLITAVGVYLMFNKQKIKQLALQEVNKHLAAPMDVNDIELTLLKQFPKVSLDLHIVRIADPLKPKSYFFQAERVFVGFNFWDIIHHQYNIKLIKMDSAVVNIRINKKGIGNYNVIKNGNNQPSDSSLLLSLEKILISGARINYNNEQSKQTAAFALSQTQLSGKFGGNNDLLSCKGNIYVNQLTNNGSKVFANKSINLNTTLKINATKGTYQIDDGYVEMDDLRLKLSGTANYNNNGAALNIQFNATNIDVATFISLIPNMADKIKQYKSEGTAYVKGGLTGNYNTKEFPIVKLNFGIKNGAISGNNNLIIKNIELEGSFDNLKNSNNNYGNILLNKFAFATNEGKVSGSGSIKNINNPYLKADLKCEMGIADMLKLFPQQVVSDAAGKFFLSVNFSGLISDLREKKIDAIVSTGNFKIDAVNILLSDKKGTIQSILASGEINKTDIVFNQAVIKYDSTVLGLKVNFKNGVPYLLLNNQRLVIDIEAIANSIDVEWIAALFTTKSDKLDKDDNDNHNDAVALKAQVYVEALKYKQFLAKQVSADLNYASHILTAKNIKLNTLSGNLTLDGQLTFANNKILASVTSNIKGLDINNLFDVCDNFGQNEITDKHIKGLVTGNIDLVGVWDEKLNCETNKLNALCELKMSNGELFNYTPLLALAKYIDVNELKHIKFAELNNTIQIKSEQIIIPECEIKNSALNLMVSGTHSFNNVIDYKVAVKLNEVLQKKRKQKPNEFNEEHTSDGGMKLYLSMKGPINNYTITYDKVSAKKQVKQDFKQEKNNIKELLKQELNIKPNDKIKEKEKDDDELEFEPE